MEAQPKDRQAYLAEYYAAQLAMRALDEKIGLLEVERNSYRILCNRIVNQALNNGIML